MIIGEKLLSYHNDAAIKQKYIDRVDWHIKQDHLTRDRGWDHGNQRGGIVGCTLEAYEHALYPIKLGIPEWLARAKETLFEGMTLQKSRTWPRDFLQAIKVGADLEKIKVPFLIFILKSTLGKFDHIEFPDVKEVFDDVIKLYSSNTHPKDFEAVVEAAFETGECAEIASARTNRTGEAAHSEGAYVAGRAADVAIAAAQAAFTPYAATQSVDAVATAIGCAGDTTYAAYFDVRANEVADAARVGEYDKLADKLLQLLQGCH